MEGENEENQKGRDATYASAKHRAARSSKARVFHRALAGLSRRALGRAEPDLGQGAGRSGAPSKLKSKRRYRCFHGGGRGRYQVAVHGLVVLEFQMLVRLGLPRLRPARAGLAPLILAAIFLGIDGLSRTPAFNEPSNRAFG